MLSFSVLCIPSLVSHLVLGRALVLEFCVLAPSLFQTLSLDVFISKMGPQVSSAASWVIMIRDGI